MRGILAGITAWVLACACGPAWAQGMAANETQLCINRCLHDAGGNAASPAYTACAAQYCSESPAPSEPALSKAALWLIDETVREGCDGRGGTFDPQGVIQRDLDGDGREDLILAQEWLVCNGPMSRSLYCGVQACTVKVYLRRGALLEQAVDILGMAVTVGSGQWPTITHVAHGGQMLAFGWDGARFAAR